ncbi:NADH-quinone oxidoreductase subunit N [bacterium]|nr:NADH-quinone oxidoreductase subunit N [bacterium]
MRDYTIFIPEFIAAGSALGIIAVDLIWPRVRKDLLAYLCAVAAIAWAVASVFYIGKTPNSFQGLIQVDDFTTYFRLMAAGIVFCIALISPNYIRGRIDAAAEYYALLLLGCCGLVFMAAARELITAYISFELISFSLYILVGFLRRDIRSNEASLKFILLGAFASAIFLYGISFIYGATGSTYYDSISKAIDANGSNTAIVVGLMLILVGIGFKLAVVPFQMWAPDAYEGAPLPITAFIATASEVAGFGLFLRLFSSAFHTGAHEWAWAVAILSAITMTLGNLVAIQQTNIKRLVAYSSIGQVGYMLVVIAAIGYGDAHAGAGASAGLLIHITGYIISTLLLFAALIAYYNRTGHDTIRGMRGMAETQPFLALIITVALFSYAGLPFFAGFTTKLLMFQSATSNGLLWLIALGVVNSAISIYYYMMIVREMYLFDPDENVKRFSINPLLAGLAGVLLLAVLFIGIYPGPVLHGASKASTPLFQAGADATSNVTAQMLPK